MSTLRSVALPLGATLAVQTLVSLGVYCAPVMAPVAARDLGVSASAIGYFIMTTYLGSMMGSVTAGGWVARFGPFRVSQVGLVLVLIGLALAASAWLPLVLLGAFVIGLGYGPATPASSHILARAAPPTLVALTFSIKQTGVPAGGVIAGALVPVMVLTLGWRESALLVGAVCFLLALVIEPARAPYDRDLNRAAPIALAAAFQPVLLVLRAPRLREMALTSFIFGGVQITLVTYLVTFLTGSFALSLVLAGFVMAVSQLASVIGRVAWGMVADRAASRRGVLGALGLGMGLSAFATLAASPHWPAWLLFVYAAAFGATAVGWNGVYLAEVARLAPAGQTSQATGGCLFFTFLGVVVVPPLFNFLLALGSGYAGAYAFFGVPAFAIGTRLLFGRGGLESGR